MLQTPATHLLVDPTVVAWCLKTDMQFAHACPDIVEVLRFANRNVQPATSARKIKHVSI